MQTLIDWILLFVQANWIIFTGVLILFIGWSYRQMFRAIFAQLSPVRREPDGRTIMDGPLIEVTPPCHKRLSDELEKLLTAHRYDTALGEPDYLLAEFILSPLTNSPERKEFVEAYFTWKEERYQRKTEELRRDQHRLFD